MCMVIHKGTLSDGSDLWGFKRGILFFTNDSMIFMEAIATQREGTKEEMQRIMPDIQGQVQVETTVRDLVDWVQAMRIPIENIMGMSTGARYLRTYMTGGESAHLLNIVFGVREIESKDFTRFADCAMLKKSDARAYANTIIQIAFRTEEFLKQVRDEMKRTAATALSKEQKK